MNRFICTLLIFWPIFSAPAWAGYSLADLEILAQEGSYEEFLKHAMDIRPSERQEKWKTMVSKMADLAARKILAKSDIDRTHFQQIETLYRWTVLRTDGAFKLHRQEIGTRYLKKCLKTPTPCWDEFKNFWEADKSDSDNAIKMAELMIQFENPPIPLWSLLELALKSPLSEFYCKKDFVMNALWGKLEIDYIRLGTAGKLLNKIDETVHYDCLPALNKAAKDRLLMPQGPLDRELAYQLLLAQDKTDQMMSDFFHIVYLLEKPSQGELFNHAWNRLSELGKSSPRREKVFQAIKKLDPLPDEIISSLDDLKKKVVLHHFKNNFPEYLDYYFNQCLKFYGGQATFPKGNPTMRCQELMSSELAVPLLDKSRVQQYLEVKKI